MANRSIMITVYNGSTNTINSTVNEHIVTIAVRINSIYILAGRQRPRYY